MESLNLLITWAQANVEQVVFYLLAILAIPLAFGVVFDRNIIRSGFMLIGVFGVIAGIFLLLQAQFLALAEIMIYGVGITLVVVIALMLTNPKMEKDLSPSLPQHTGPAAFVSVLVFLTIYMSLRSSEPWPLKTEPMQSTAANIQNIGYHLLSEYSLPFEFISILLLAALIGAVMMAKAEPAVPDRPLVDSESKPNASERTDDVVKI